MAAADVQQLLPDPAPSVPDYLASPDAVLGDSSADWRYGRAPDYSKTREAWEQTKQKNHTAGSLPQLVENLVKNWEVEASFKPNLADWRTIDHANYTFAINGGPPQSAEYMLKVGTYNAIIAPNEYYSPEASDFASSHKTFKRMMPTFAWEVLEVYSGPPQVAFRWRHWGTMKNDYVGFNDIGEMVRAKAHGGQIDIEGVTVAQVDDKVRLQKVETWFDPMEMFRQIAPNGIVNKETVRSKSVPDEQATTEARTTELPIMSKNGKDAGPISSAHHDHIRKDDAAKPTFLHDDDKKDDGQVTSSVRTDKDLGDAKVPITIHSDDQKDVVTGSGSSIEDKIHAAEKPEVAPANALATPLEAEPAVMTHKEMSQISPSGCPFMNKE